ncbi:pyrroloquinoline quinone precursor peptide PqqA [Streptomyces sp. HMX87]|uniref:pyrroloquinoline quinone precursor peptide PqqA n=1 Tax=Streptomyces sp. HMX87 TaxID=3390849 RepID=UPI003A85C093
MHETEDRTKPVEQVEQSPARQPEPATWQAPGFTVVDTALEVTAYYAPDSR